MNEKEERAKYRALRSPISYIESIRVRPIYADKLFPTWEILTEPLLSRSSYSIVMFHKKYIMTYRIKSFFQIKKYHNQFCDYLKNV